MVAYHISDANIIRRMEFSLFCTLFYFFLFGYGRLFLFVFCNKIIYDSNISVKNIYTEHIIK